MMDDWIVDHNGILRRCGTWVPPEGFVSALPPTTDSPEFEEWDDEKIREVLLDKDRRKSDLIFPAEKWIMDQEGTSACNGFATAAAYSRTRRLRGITDGFQASGSYSYSKCNGGRDAGSSLDCTLIQNGRDGFCSKDLCTTQMIYPRLQPKSCDAEAKKHKGLRAYHCPTKRAWRTALAAGRQGISVLQNGKRFNQFSKVDSGSPCVMLAGADGGNGNHALCTTDMRIIDGQEMYLQANSWSTRFAGTGQVWVTWDSFEQPFERHDFFVIASTLET